jgi:hypothetical protein
MAISPRKPSSISVVIPCSEVVVTQILVILLACEEVLVVYTPRFACAFAICIITGVLVLEGVGLEGSIAAVINL